MNLKVLFPDKNQNVVRLEDTDTHSFVDAVRTDEPDGIEKKLIFVPNKQRGKGVGSELLKKMIGLINIQFPDFPIYLLAMPMPGCPMTLEQLINWYQKHGFVPITGDNQAKIMVYDPDNLLQEYHKRS